MMAEDQDQLILKLLDGTIDVDERKKLESWMIASDENRKVVERYILLWNASRPDASLHDFQTVEEWKRLSDTLSIARETKTRRLPPTLYLKIAASITLLAIVSFFIFRQLNPGSITVKGNGPITEVLLPDHSKVWLQEGSEIKYRKDFTKEIRAVALTGQAFFDVAKQPEHPFVISTRHAQVTVVGTSFNVNANNKNTCTSIFVVTGKVKIEAVTGSAHSLLLSPGEEGTIDHATETATLQSEPDLNAMAWREHKLVFRKASLQKVVVAVNEYFHADIKIKNDDLLNCRFTSSFDDPTLDEVVNALTIALNLRQVRQPNGTITLDGEGCR